MPYSLFSSTIDVTYMIDPTLLALQSIQDDLYHRNGHCLLMKSLHNLELLYAELVEQEVQTVKWNFSWNLFLYNLHLQS